MMTFIRSMAGRVFLILLVGVLVSAALTWWLASGERQRTIGQFRETRALEQAEQFIATLDAIPAAGRQAFLSTSRRFGLRAETVDNQTRVPTAIEPPTVFSSALGERLGTDFKLAMLPADPAGCRARRMQRGEAPASALRGVCETIEVTLRDGEQVRLTMLPPRMAVTPYRRDALIFLGVFLVSIALLAFVVARMATRPLRQLAHAAEALGRNIDHPPLTEQGSSEIRQATAAFNAMQNRLRDHLRQRTHMLAAITHDLQTPLTRLRLRLEKVSDPQLRDKLIDDLSHTQTIVREGLDLARSMNPVQPLQPLDLDSLLDSVCTDAADAGQPVALEGRLGMPVMADPGALRRCLTNLIDNAVKYGHFAKVSARQESGGTGDWISIRVRDGGPGIAQEELKKVFEPFYRIENSRSRATGGSGLGLSIARNIAQQHAGDITLANYPGGGLQATLMLPARIVRTL